MYVRTVCQVKVALHAQVKSIVEHVIERLRNLDKVLLPMPALFSQCQDSSVKKQTVVSCLFVGVY